MMDTSYQAGRWLVAVAENGIAAIPAGAHEDRIEELWRMLQAGVPALPEVIDVLAGGSLATLGAFAVALYDGGGARIAVRGSARVVALGADGAREDASGEHVSTWSERFVPGFTGLELQLDGGVDEARMPIGSGVVLAGAVRVGDGAQPAVTEEEPASVLAAGPGDAPASADAPAGQPVADEAAAVPEHAAAASAPDPVSPPEPAVVPPAADPAYTLLPAELTVAPDDDPFGATVHAPVVPASAPAPPPLPATEPVAVEAGAGDHDGATISLAEARRLRTGTASPEAPTVQMPAVAEPGSTGRVRVSTGQVVTLDRTVIIGRRPRSTRASGAELPHLIAVDSPQQDISRSHLEIRPEGDAVVIIDLHTTNGSTLLRPGADPVRLHPGEQTLVLDGDVVDLGDGVTVVFEGIA